MVATQSIAGQIKDRLQSESVVWIDASMEEYWDILAELTDEPDSTAYDVEYLNHQIRAKVSQASDNHETIAANVIRLLGQLFYHDDAIRVMGSNKVVYVPDCQLAVNPDVLVMQGASQLLPRPGQAAGIVNPYLLIEVYSDSTERHDTFIKLMCYKRLESLHQIIYINQHQPQVSVFTKNGDTYHWLNVDYDQLDANAQIGNGAIPLAEIYHKIVFTKPV